MEEYGVTPSAFWCGWGGPQVWDFYDGQLTLGLVPTEYRAMRVQQLCDGADFAKKLGITDVVTHMGFIPENPNDPNFAPFCVAVRTVAQHLKENGQNLLFETGQETPVTMLRCFEKVGMDNLFVNLDTANLILYRSNVETMIEKVKGSVKGIFLVSPYIIEPNTEDAMRHRMDEYVSICRELAEKHSCRFVDFQQMYANYCQYRHSSYIAWDRIHPNQIGATLMAKTFLEACGFEYGK